MSLVKKDRREYFPNLLLFVYMGFVNNALGKSNFMIVACNHNLIQTFIYTAMMMVRQTANANGTILNHTLVTNY